MPERIPNPKPIPSPKPLPEPEPFPPHEVLVHPYYDFLIRDLIIRWPRLTYVDILVVVDTEISTDPGNSFGVARVIELIRNTAIGCMRFRVDIALRDGSAQSVTASPTPTQPKYVGFRFDMMQAGVHVIDKYEQIWCFGFKPDNSGLGDDRIGMAFAFPASDAELTKLDQWMTAKKGGLFGTGDHDYLGASMCHRIPRLGTMRRWTNADGVPPIGTPDRIDTLRPPSAAYMPGAPGQQSLDNNLHQGDLTVQPIRWVADDSHWVSLFVRHKRPHPVLCHPTLGPIDVMPDHAHEGLCVPNPDLAANKKFVAQPEYPDATGGGAKPAPKIIAYGSNLAQPPYLFTKGVQPARNNNPMIAVYDGHPAGVGRVGCDSTWHHWMDVNIDDMRIANNTDWKKISRYFQNLAVWLCPPGFTTRCFYLSVLASHFQVVGFQEYYRGATTVELGEALRHHLHVHFGACWVTERIWLTVLDLKLIDIKRLPELREKLPDAVLDGELLENLILGRMVEATMEPAQKIKELAGGKRGQKIEPLPEPEELFAEPIRSAFGEFAELMKRRCGEESELLQAALVQPTRKG
jgi:hypothetical protein